MLHAIPIVDLLPWKLSLAFLYLPLYALANLHKDIIRELAPSRAVWILPALLAGLVGCRFVNFENNLLQNYLLVASVLALAPAYILSIKWLSKARLGAAAQFVGGNTIILLALQNYVIGACKFLMPGYESWGIWANLLFTAVTLLLCIVPIYLINTYVPFIVGRGPLFKRKG